MIDDPPSKPPKDYRAAIRGITLGYAPFLWCSGYAMCWIRGLDGDDTFMNTVTYTLTGFAAWLFYLLVLRPDFLRADSILPAQIPLMNFHYLQPTVPPWPFWRMLGFYLVVSIVNMLVLTFFLRWTFSAIRGGGKPRLPSSAHPLSDDQIG